MLSRFFFLIRNTNNNISNNVILRKNFRNTKFKINEDNIILYPFNLIIIIIIIARLYLKLSSRHNKNKTCLLIFMFDNNPLLFSKCLKD